MTSPLRRYLVLEHAIPAAVINFLLNALIAWLSFRHADEVPMWGQQSIGGDLLGTTIILPLLTCAIVTRIVRMHFRQGRFASADMAYSPSETIRRFPQGLLARGLTFGAVTTVLAAPVILALLYAAGISALDLHTFVLFKATYAAILAMIVQPVIALRAMLDRGTEAEELPGVSPATPS